ncbi:hypothetical protein ACWGOK_41540, partial [Streptomyces eurythermus]
RYTGPDDKRYLHVVTWHQHQKINRPSKSRLPACPHHDTVGRAARACLTEAAPLPHGTLREGSRQQQETAVNRGDDSVTAGQNGFTEPSVKAHDPLTEQSVSPQGPDLGPRNMDLGDTPSGGASAPAPRSISTNELIAEYAAACTHRPPKNVLGHLAHEVRKLLDEGIDPAHIRAGLERHRAKGLHPSTLPSLVHEAMNAAPVRQVVHRSWTNPADVAAAYGDQL